MSPSAHGARRASSRSCVACLMLASESMPESILAISAILEGPSAESTLVATRPSSVVRTTTRCRSSEDRDLRQVSDHYHLVVAGQACESPPHSLGRGAADTCIDLVEDEDGDVVGTAEHALEREHDTRDLAAGCDAREWTRGFGGRCREEELDLVGTGACPGLEWSRCERHLETCGLHRELGACHGECVDKRRRSFLPQALEVAKPCLAGPPRLRRRRAWPPPDPPPPSRESPDAREPRRASSERPRASGRTSSSARLGSPGVPRPPQAFAGRAPGPRRSPASRRSHRPVPCRPAPGS